MTKTNTKAFTLIELLIVIVIIGILAVALIPRLTGAQASARDTARKATIQQAGTVIASFYSQDATATTSAMPQFLTGAMPANLISYGNLPTKDPQGKGIFVTTGTNSSYILCVEMEKDGQGNALAANCTTPMASTAAAEFALTGGVAGSGKVYMLKVSY